MADDKQASYKVFVDDNSHYQEESQRYLLGAFDDCQSAISKCQQVVDAYLKEAYQRGMTASELYRSYTSFGEDPWIVSADGKCAFSAWSYAKQRCKEICGAHP